MKTIQEKNGEVEYVLTSEEYKRLHEANQEMLEALKLCLDGFEDVSKNHGVSYITEIVDARAAISKGEQQ